MRTVNITLLKKWSKGKRTPQLELALKAGVGTGTVSNMFRGTCPATQRVRVKIAEALNIDEDILFPEKRLAA